MPEFKHIFPLLDAQMFKQDAHGLCNKLKIKRPIMYDMGYSNNNCVGCVKGGMGYWNKIRKDFPETFERMARLERKINAHALKECYLDELDPNRGRMADEIMEDCNIFCQIQLEK